MNLKGTVIFQERFPEEVKIVDSQMKAKNNTTILPNATKEKISFLMIRTENLITDVKEVLMLRSVIVRTRTTVTAKTMDQKIMDRVASRTKREQMVLLTIGMRTEPMAHLMAET